MCRIDKAPPPRESPSNFVKTAPVMLNCSLNELATLTISCPVRASTTNNISCGCTICLIFDNSFIKGSSICKRPAVSIIITSLLFSRAKRIASSTIDSADCEVPFS